MKKLFNLLGRHTPKVGAQIRNAGAIAATATALTEAIPEGICIQVHPAAPEWLQAAQLVIYALSIFLVGAGQAQVKGDPDNL